MALLALFADDEAVARLFRTVRWQGNVFCPHCKQTNVIKHCRYKVHLQRYACKDCKKTFNDKTGTLIHYKHIRLGNWMAMLWFFMCGPRNGVSINFLTGVTGHIYKTTYYLIRAIMNKIVHLPERKLKGTTETDEGYYKSASKGVPLATNGEDRTLPSRRVLPRMPGRGTFKKNTPMVTIYFQRATDDEQDITIMDVPRGGKRLATMVRDHIEPGSVVITDEYKAYNRLGEMGYDHRTVNHSEGEYASGDNNEIHTNNCECRIGLLKWWLKKHRGVSKWYLKLYVKSFQFVHNHRHYDFDDRFVATLAMVLDQFEGVQA